MNKASGGIRTRDPRLTKHWEDGKHTCSITLRDSSRNLLKLRVETQQFIVLKELLFLKQLSPDKRLHIIRARAAKYCSVVGTCREAIGPALLGDDIRWIRAFIKSREARRHCLCSKKKRIRSMLVLLSLQKC